MQKLIIIACAEQVFSSAENSLLDSYCQEFDEVETIEVQNENADDKEYLQFFLGDEVIQTFLDQDSIFVVAANHLLVVACFFTIFSDVSKTSEKKHEAFVLYTDANGNPQLG